MFEKEAEEYAKQNNPAKYGVKTTHFTVLNAFKAGAEFGYNKCGEEIEEEIAELKKDKEDLIFILFQKVKCMREDKQMLTQAKKIISNLYAICKDNHYPNSSVLMEQAERFLKETKDIREDSTYHGDWIVDEH